MLVQDVLRVLRLQNESSLYFHELLAYLLMHLRKHWVTFLIADERSSGQLDCKKFLSKETINNLTIREIRSEHDHYGQVYAVFNQVFQF